jgi:hypothetical protein
MRIRSSQAAKIAALAKALARDEESRDRLLASHRN